MTAGMEEKPEQAPPVGNCPRCGSGNIERDSVRYEYHKQVLVAALYDFKCHGCGELIRIRVNAEDDPSLW